MHRIEFKEMSKETENYIRTNYEKELQGLEVLKGWEQNLTKWAFYFGSAALGMFVLSKGVKRVKRSGQIALDITMQNDPELDKLFRLDDEHVYTEQQQTEE